MNNEDLTPHRNHGQQPQKNTNTPNQIPVKTYALISLILSMVSLIFMCFPPVQMVLGVLAIMFAVLSRKDKVFTSHAKVGLTIGFVSCIASFYYWSLVAQNLSSPETVNWYNELEQIFKQYEQIYNNGAQS